jgi:8-amino-3,8-dideoxy-alpha-D-manno-octulosonate transaminase
MGELAGAVAGVQLARLPYILAALRTNKARIVDAVGEVDGLTRRRRPDPEGDGSSSITWFLPDAALAKRFAAAVRAEGIPCAQMYRGRPVYLNAGVLARRTASDKGGPFACAEHPTDRTYGPGVCPRTEELVARSVIVPVGVGYSDRDCADIAAGVRKVACALLQ